MTTTMTTPVERAAGTDRGWHGSGFGTQVLVLTARSLRALARNPRMIVFSLAQPLVMLTLFSQVFSSIAKTPGFPTGVSYIDYLLPAILITTAMGAAMTSGAGLITDMTNGMVARFRSMPIQLATVLIARSLADLVRTAVQLLIMVVAASLVFGFDPAAGIPGVLGAMLLALVVGWSLGWVFLAIATWVRNAEAMQTVSFLAMFPLMFGSSAYVPLRGLPGWVQVVAKANPLTYAIDGARGLTLGTSAAATVGAALATCVVIAAVGAALAIRGFQRPT